MPKIWTCPEMIFGFKNNKHNTIFEYEIKCHKMPQNAIKGHKMTKNDIKCHTF